MKFVPIYFACLFICTGYGITFALFAILVEATGVTGSWIGFNAALPAVGWIVGALLVPVLQLNLGIAIKKIAICFLLFALIGLFIPMYSESYLGLSLTRFIFGGAMGVFLRCVEYILVANAPPEKKGKFLAIYGATFLAGMIVGSIVQPRFEGAVDPTLFSVLALLVVGGVIFSLARIKIDMIEFTKIDMSSVSLIAVFPIAFLGVVAYSLYESLPAYLLQVFALRHGLGEAVAAYTLAAAALGNLLFLIPILMLSDKIGRANVLVGCATVAVLVPLAITVSLQNSSIFLILVGLLGAAAGASYGLSLAMLGDRFRQATLVMANAIFGVLYAIGSVLGPLLHGASIELFGNQALMYSVSAIFLVLLLAIIMIQRREGVRHRQ